MLKVFIVDDERPARVKLKHQLAQLDGISLIGEADNAESAIEEINALEPDLLLLDIELGELNGFDVLDAINSHCHIIFTTAYSQYAVQAFENKALDYLLKPFPLARLQQAISRVVAQVNTKPQLVTEYSQQRITAKVADRIHLLNPQDIIFVHSRHAITYAQLREREFALESPLETIAQQLGQSFIRIHRNCLVNSQHISQLERWQNGNYLLRFHNIETTVTSSRSGASNLKQYFKL